jgi:hypothetical protein
MKDVRMKLSIDLSPVVSLERRIKAASLRDEANIAGAIRGLTEAVPEELAQNPETGRGDEACEETRHSYPR